MTRPRETRAFIARRGTFSNGTFDMAKTTTLTSPTDSHCKERAVRPALRGEIEGDDLHRRTQDTHREGTVARAVCKETKIEKWPGRE